MPKITKEEFATKLLFALFEWPLTESLPRSLMINYLSPFPPGPGPSKPPQGPPKGNVFFNQDYWTPLDANTTWVDGHWHCVFPGVGPHTNLGVNGAWFVNYRPSYIHISFTESTLNDINIDLIEDEIMGGAIAGGNNVESDVYFPITWNVDDIAYIHIEQTDPGLNPININLIEFL